jgi:hypothetical protein
MYWKRKGSRKFNQAACQAGKARARMERPLEPRPVDRSGEHHRQIIIRDFLAGVEHTFDLFVSSERCDSYRVVVDKDFCLAERYGWSDAMDLVRKCFVRVGRID